ncbi:MAG: DUF151 domain-containing protein [Planctomycetia bacterium]|nr:DUF151 domain-containing protein [Planctomycetia bacterium]
MYIEMTLSRMVLREGDDTGFLFLREVRGTREFCIGVGVLEMVALRRLLDREPTNSGPLPHQLLCDLVHQLGSGLRDVILDCDEAGGFGARLRLVRDGTLLDVAARPSDALGVALSCRPALRIFVNERVLNQLEIET